MLRWRNAGLERQNSTYRESSERKRSRSQTGCTHLSSHKGWGKYILPYTFSSCAFLLLLFFACYCSLYRIETLVIYWEYKTSAGSSNRFYIRMHCHAQRRLFLTGPKFDVTLMTSAAYVFRQCCEQWLIWCYLQRHAWALYLHVFLCYLAACGHIWDSSVLNNILHDFWCSVHFSHFPLYFECQTHSLWLRQYFVLVCVWMYTCRLWRWYQPLCKWTAIGLKYWSRLRQVDVTQTIRVWGEEGFLSGASLVTDHISTDIFVNNCHSSRVKLLFKVWSDIYTACNFLFASILCGKGRTS